MQQWTDVGGSVEDDFMLKGLHRQKPAC